MKLATLNYIHDLLIHNKEAHDRAKIMTHDALRKAENEEASNVKTLTEVYIKSRESYFDASDVLKDFEQHEWR